MILDGVEGAVEIAHEYGPDAYIIIKGVAETVESAREPRTDAYQEHGMYKQLVEELPDEMRTL